MSLGISTDNHIKDNQKFLSDNYKKSIIFAMLSKSASMQVMRIFWVVLGSVSLALGLVNIFIDNRRQWLSIHFSTQIGAYPVKDNNGVVE